MHKWPWDKKFYKPDTTGTYDGRIRELTKAGALICAEIDRLIRVKERVEGGLFSKASNSHQNTDTLIKDLKNNN